MRSLLLLLLTGTAIAQTTVPATTSTPASTPVAPVKIPSCNKGCSVTLTAANIPSLSIAIPALTVNFPKMAFNCTQGTPSYDASGKLTGVTGLVCNLTVVK